MSEKEKVIEFVFTYIKIKPYYYAHILYERYRYEFQF